MKHNLTGRAYDMFFSDGVLKNHQLYSLVGRRLFDSGKMGF